MSHKYRQGELISYTGKVYPTDMVYVFVRYYFNMDTVAVIRIKNDKSEFNVFVTNIKPFYPKDTTNKAAVHLLEKED